MLHPSKDPEKSYRNKLFFSYKGIFFLQDYYSQDVEKGPFNVLFNILSQFENPFTNCDKCKKYDAYSKSLIHFNPTKEYISKSLFRQYILCVFFELPLNLTLPSVSHLFEPSSSNDVPHQEPIVNDVRLIQFILFNDLPSKGGTISCEMNDFPILNFQPSAKYEFLFNLKYLSLKKQDELESIAFAIWVDYCDGDKRILLTQKLSNEIEKIVFQPPYNPTNIQYPIYYGELENYVIWGKCSVSPSYSPSILIEKSDEVPDCVKEFNLSLLLTTEMKRCTNHFQLSNLPPSPSSSKTHLNTHDLELEINHKQSKIHSFWFVLQNNITLSDEIITDQKKRSTVYENTYLPKQKRNFYLKCVITDDFSHPKFPLEAHDFLIDQSEIELEKRNKFFFNFIADPSIDLSDLPQSIPSMIYIKYKSKLSILNLKSSFEKAIETNGLFGHEMGNVSFYSITNFNKETKFLTVIFT